MNSDTSNAQVVILGGGIAGASVHAGKHQHEMSHWIKSHRDALEARPGAFFSVSLTAAEETPEEREPAVRILREFLADVGWEPELSATIAGALLYREYDPFTRTVIKLMMKSGGHPTDSSRDYEYTNWHMVDEFARSVAALAVAEDPALQSAVEPR
jgi:menaquinone-dependent protoporphyrinogen oxidase